MALAGCASQAPEAPEATPPLSTTDSTDEVLALQYAEPGPDWLTYHDPEGRFAIDYPPDWLQTDATTEIQFWDDLSDDVNSIKMSLRTETRSPEEIQSQEPEDIGPHFQRHFYTYDVNGHPTLAEVGWSDIASYRTYYYELNDGTQLSFNAWFHDDDDAIWQDALTIQQSFKWLED